MNYEITVSYSEKKGTHTIVEKWLCRGEKSLKRTLGEALDMQLGKDRIPVEPTEAGLEALRRYADEEFVKDEFRRQTKAWKTYSDVVRTVLGGAEANGKIDSRTSVLVKGVK